MGKRQQIWEGPSPSEVQVKCPSCGTVRYYTAKEAAKISGYCKRCRHRKDEKIVLDK